MDYYCDVCDKTIKIKSKIKQLRNLTHNEVDKGKKKTKCFIQNPELFDVVEMFD